MTDRERDAFLAPPRLGMLTTLRGDGSPVTVPVWFAWDGSALRMFSGAASGKVGRIKRDPRASLLVANSLGQAEAWVAFDGKAEIKREGAIELAEGLAIRYWDMSDPEHKKTLESWHAAAAALVVIELKPAAVRTSKG